MSKTNYQKKRRNIMNKELRAKYVKGEIKDFPVETCNGKRNRQKGKS